VQGKVNIFRGAMMEMMGIAKNFGNFIA